MVQRTEELKSTSPREMLVDHYIRMGPQKRCSEVFWPNSSSMRLLLHAGRFLVCGVPCHQTLHVVFESMGSPSPLSTSIRCTWQSTWCTLNIWLQAVCPGRMALEDSSSCCNHHNGISDSCSICLDKVGAVTGTVIDNHTNHYNCTKTSFGWMTSAKLSSSHSFV